MVLDMSFELSNMTITTLCIFLFCYLHLDVDYPYTTFKRNKEAIDPVATT